MNGMASTDGSETVFSPNTSLTRAQMATLLSRMIEKIDKNTFVSMGKNTPFDGFEVCGNPLLTMVNGKVVYKK